LFQWHLDDDQTSVTGQGSPVNRGLMVVHGQVFKRAVAICRRSPPQRKKTASISALVEPWRWCQSSLIDATLAYRGDRPTSRPPTNALLTQA
jgi:hypothetical protein